MKVSLMRVALIGLRIVDKYQFKVSDYGVCESAGHRVNLFENGDEIIWDDGTFLSVGKLSH